MSGDSETVTQEDVAEVISHTLQTQSNAIKTLNNSETINQIKQAAQIIDETEGRTVFTGIGKSGDVAKKIVATFNSIGASSHFIHPVEALHGDLGMITRKDAVVLISNSGNTDELVELLQFLDYFDPRTVAITSDYNSKLAQGADHHIDTQVTREGALVDLVPMASATATMVIGDCIANALMHRRNFGKQDFGHFHPGGVIGKRLLLDVGDILYAEIPRTKKDDTLAEVAVRMSEGQKGIAVVRDDNNRIRGVLTDGDIRRVIESGVDLHDTFAEDVMITDPITVSPETSVIKAFELIEEHDITQLVVEDDNNKFVGVVHIHDIIQQGIKNT